MAGGVPRESVEAEAQAEARDFAPAALAMPATAVGAVLRLQRTVGNRAVAALIARGPPDAPTQEMEAKDPLAGTLVRQIVVSLARGRVGFDTALGMIMGKVKTDLAPGAYKLRLEAAKKRWRIVAPAVKPGWRFEVELEGADPWTLTYPEEIPMQVAAGTVEEPKTAGDMLGPDGKLKDPLWPYEGMPPELRPRPIQGIDDFESVHYDIDYRSEKGNLSKWITVNYRDGTSKDVNIDSIKEGTPKLWAARKDVLKIMDDYNALFILGAFPTVWFLLTMVPTVSTPGTGTRGYSVRRVQVPKRGGLGGKAGGEPEVGGGGGTRTEPRIGAAGEAPTFASQQVKAQELAGSMAAKGERVVVNIGGAGASHEPQGAINVNNQAVARKDIPNLVQADGSKVGELFKPGSVDRIEGHNMAPGAVEWNQAAPGAYKILKPGGQLQYYYRGANADAQAAEAALNRAGFKDVKNVSDVLITATKPGG
jgi:hypothetical protein